MAGQNIKYKSFFYNDNGVYCTVYIKKSGYEGAETELEMGPDPVVIKWVGASDDKFTHIKPKEVYIQFVVTSPLQLLGLFTEKAKTYEVEVWESTDLVFTGFINPEYYEEPFMPAPHIITVHAMDGLPELKAIDLAIPGYTSSDFRQTAMYYLHTCLSQVGYTFNTIGYEVAVNIDFTTAAGAVTARVLEYIYMDYRAFQDEEGDFMNCFDVVNEICKSFNARLYQHGDVWRFERLDQKQDDFLKYIYTYEGNYSTTATQNDELALTAHVGRGTDIRFKAGASLLVQPAYKYFNIVQDYGQRKNLLNTTKWNKCFTRDDFSVIGTYDATPRFWTKHGGIQVVYQKSKADDENGWEAIRLRSIFTSSADYLISDTVNVEDLGVQNLDNLIYAWGNSDISLVFSFDVRKQFYARREINNFIANIQLNASFSGTTYRGENASASGVNVLGQQGLNTGWTVRSSNTETRGTFTPSVQVDTISLDLNDTNDWVNTTVEFPLPPDAEIKTQSYLRFSVMLFQCATSLSINDVETDDGLLYRNMRLYFKSNVTEGTRTIKTDIDSDNILEPPDYDVKFGNTPSPIWMTGRADAYGLINKHVMYDSTGDYINSFAFHLSTPIQDKLIDTIIATDLNVTYRRPQFKLRGTIKDTVGSMDFPVCLEDYDSRWYVPLSLAYHMKPVEWTGEWLQMWDDSGTGEFNDDFSEDFFI